MLKRHPFLYWTRRNDMTNSELGWVVINILIPIFLPIVGVIPFKILSLPTGIQVRFLALIKDGQWCWTAIAIGASSIHEIWNAATQHLLMPDHMGWHLFLLITLMMLGVVIAAGGAIFSSSLTYQSSSFNTVSSYRTVICSLFIVFSISFIALYFHTSLIKLNMKAHCGT